jgi:hypothetical protein
MSERDQLKPERGRRISEKGDKPLNECQTIRRKSGGVSPYEARPIQVLMEAIDASYCTWFKGLTIHCKVVTVEARRVNDRGGGACQINVEGTAYDPEKNRDCRRGHLSLGFCASS